MRNGKHTTIYFRLMKNVALCDLVAAAHTSVASADEHKEFRSILKCIARGCLSMECQPTCQAKMRRGIAPPAKS